MFYFNKEYKVEHRQFLNTFLIAITSPYVHRVLLDTEIKLQQSSLADMDENILFRIVDLQKTSKII